MYACMGMHAIACMWGSEGSFIELILSFHLYVGAGDQTQYLRLEQQGPLPRATLLAPKHLVYLFDLFVCIDTGSLTRLEIVLSTRSAREPQ